MITHGTKHGSLVLQPMSLVDHQILPREPPQRLLLGIRHFVGSHANIPRTRIVGIIVLQFPLFVGDLFVGSTAVVRGGVVGEVFLGEVFAFFLVAVESNGSEGWTPKREKKMFFFLNAGLQWIAKRESDIEYTNSYQRLSSFIQLLRVDFGTQIKCGPCIFMYS